MDFSKMSSSEIDALFRDLEKEQQKRKKQEEEEKLARAKAEREAKEKKIAGARKNLAKAFYNYFVAKDGKSEYSPEELEKILSTVDYTFKFKKRSDFFPFDDLFF